MTQTLLFQFLSSRIYSSIHDSSSQLEPISAGMRIKGKEKKHSPFPLPPKAPPIHAVPFFSFKCSLFKSYICTKTKKKKKEKKKSEWHIHSTNTSSCPHSTFSLQPETNLSGKLRAVQHGTTHSLQAFNCWGQADTHSHTLTHSHKMAALTKISSTPKAAYEVNYNLAAEGRELQSPLALLIS